MTFNWWTETRVAGFVVGLALFGFLAMWVGTEKRIALEAQWLEPRLERHFEQSDLEQMTAAETGLPAKSFERLKESQRPKLVGQFRMRFWRWRAAGKVALGLALVLLVISRITGVQHVPELWWVALTIGPLFFSLQILKRHAAAADSGVLERLAVSQAGALTALGIFVALRWRG